jgi:3,4-dihydroxy-2-butanone 4-phosphate synthase
MTGRFLTIIWKNTGTATGISAHDRALTARKLASSTAVAADFNRPGHLCPLRAREGGVLTRRGHTEAGLGELLCLSRVRYALLTVCSNHGHTFGADLLCLQDLCRLTGLTPAALLCELINDDEQGTMSRRDDCRAFADTWGLKMISIAQLADLRRAMESNDKTQAPFNGTKIHRSPNGKH